MEICINYGGKRHCFFLPVMEFPVRWGRPGPGPINDPAFIQDVMILASVSNVAKHLTNEKIRKALDDGLSASFKAAQENAGPDVTINASATMHS
jgi:hypothetical protein